MCQPRYEPPCPWCAAGDLCDGTCPEAEKAKREKTQLSGDEQVEQDDSTLYPPCVIIFVGQVCQCPFADNRIIRLLQFQPFPRVNRGNLMDMHKTRSPKQLWDYCSEWVTRIRRLTALNIPGLEGCVPFEQVKGYTPDISPYALFTWYQPVWIYTKIAGFPEDTKEMGMWLGTDDECIDIMAFHVIVASGKVLTRKEVWAVSDLELQEITVQERLSDLKEAINAKIGDHLKDEDIDPDTSETIDGSIPEELFIDDDDEVEPITKETLHQGFR